MIPNTGPPAHFRLTMECDELRVAFAYAKRYTYFAIVFTLRDNGETFLIIPISARYMHKKEITAHEKEIP